MNAVVPIRPGIVIPSMAYPLLRDGRDQPGGKPIRGLHPLRRLAAHGLNELVVRELVSACPVQHETGHIATRIADRPTMVLWTDVGGGELRLSVWWDFNLGRHPQAGGQEWVRETFQSATPLARRARYAEFVGATVSCWVERRCGVLAAGAGRFLPIRSVREARHARSAGGYSRPCSDGFCDARQILRMSDGVDSSRTGLPNIPTDRSRDG